MRIMEPLPPSSPSSAHEPIFEPLENSEEYQMQLLKISKFNDAAARGDLQEIYVRLNEGQNPMLYLEDGNTALHHACFHGHLNVAEYFLDNEMYESPDPLNVEGQTPLHVSCQNDGTCTIELIKYLIKMGADNKIEDKSGKKPWETAEEYLEANPQYEQIVQVLKTYDRVLELKTTCEYLGISFETEGHLHWLAASFIHMPLPEGVIEATDDEGNAYYFNVKTGESQWGHPSLETFTAEVAHQRRQYSLLRQTNILGPLAMKKRYFRKWGKLYMKMCWREKWGDSRALVHLKKRLLRPIFSHFRQNIRRKKIIKKFRQKIIRRTAGKLLPKILKKWRKFAAKRVAKYGPTRRKVTKHLLLTLGRRVFHTWKYNAAILGRRRAKLKKKVAIAEKYHLRKILRMWTLNAQQRLAQRREKLQGLFLQHTAIFSKAELDRHEHEFTSKLKNRKFGSSFYDLDTLILLGMLNKTFRKAIGSVWKYVSDLSLFCTSNSSIPRILRSISLMANLKSFSCCTCLPGHHRQILETLSRHCRNLAALNTPAVVNKALNLSFDKLMFNCCNVDSITLTECYNIPSLLPVIRTALNKWEQLQHVNIINVKADVASNAVQIGKGSSFGSTDTRNQSELPVSDSFLRALSRGKAKPRCISMAGIQGFTSRGVMDLVSRSTTYLTSLDLSFTLSLCEVGVLHIFKSTNTNLRELNLERAMRPGKYIPTKMFNETNNKFVVLENLCKLNVCYLTHEDPGRAGLDSLVLFMKKLKTLKATWPVRDVSNLLYSGNQSGVEHVRISSIKNEFSSLKAHSAVRNDSLTSIFLEGGGVRTRDISLILCNTPNLRKLEFLNCNSIFDEEFKKHRTMVIQNWEEKITKLEHVSFRHCPHAGNIIVGAVLFCSRHTLNRFELEGTGCTEVLWMSCPETTLLQIDSLLLAGCSHLTLDVLADCLGRKSSTQLKRLVLSSMEHISLNVMHKILDVRSLIALEVYKCCFTNVMLRRLSLRLKRLVLKDLVVPKSKFEKNADVATNNHDEKFQDEWINDLLARSRQRKNNGTKIDDESSIVCDLSRYGIDAMLSRLKMLTYLDVTMPNKEEQVWFNRRRERYFRDDRGIDSASLHVKKWLKIKQFWKSKQFHNGAPMALLPSAAGLKAVRNEDSQKVQETSIDGVNWFKKNVKDNLVLLKRRKRGKKQV